MENYCLGFAKIQKIYHPKIASPAWGVSFSLVLSTVKFKIVCVILLTSGEKAHPLGESVEWAFSLAFSVFYDISAYFIVSPIQPESATTGSTAE